MQDGASVLHLKMAHTVLKVLDDCEMMLMHGFNFLKKHIFQTKAKLRTLKGASEQQDTTTSDKEVQCA